MSDVVVTVVESNTNVTVTEQDVAVTVTETTVEVSAATAGIQGNPGANNDPVYVTVRNATGALITKGSIVYVSGGNGTHTQVTKAIASGDSTSARTLGWLADDIANNADGLCMVEGYLDGVDTQGVTEGSQLYLSGTVAGAYQVAKPVAPIHLVYVGVCVKASAGNGRVYVKVQNGYELSEIHDVLIVSPTNNQVLAYDSATQLWKNATNAPDGVTSITATAPLTGGTITSTGSIGLDQTALSITKSQVSDFTSGTVTSASTAQQSGTAVFASFSGIATSATSAATATNAGTAVYATTSGTAVTISGDITKSQVSDFTSGTVASAGTAQQAGTAVFADTSGTAVYATTSGTATYADTSGTAVFATNASTAVTISGSITQSQVTNLTTDLANTAKLNTANTFSVGGHVINSSDVNAVPLAIRNATGQNGNSFEIRNNAGTPVLGIFQTGTVFFGPTQTTSGSFVSGISGRAFFNTTDAATSPLILRGATSQSADLQQWQNSSGTILSLVNSSGSFRVASIGAIAAGNAALTPGGDTNGFLLATVNAGNKGLTIRGAASQSANLQEWQNSAGTVLAFINSGGTFRGPIIQTSGAGADLREGSGGGGLATLIKMGSLPANPGANAGRIYFRDGTTAGTLKLVVRAGAAGAETTILDNIPQ